MTSLATKMTTTMKAHCQTFTKIKLSPVWRMFIVLLLVVTVVFLLTKIFQPRLMGWPSSEPTTGFEVWIHEQQERRARIAQFCKSARRLRTRINKLTFYFNEEHRLLFCFQHKVGSTTWLDHFVSIAESSTQEKLSNLSRSDKVDFLAPSHPNILTLAKTSLSVSMIASFRNRMKIWTQIRASITSQFGDISFSSFVKWLLSYRKRRNGDLCPHYGSTDVACHLNSHWAPLHTRCDYCSMPYDVIAKLETYEDDIRYIGWLAKVTFNTASRENVSKKNTSSVALEYFKQLKREEVVALYEFYKEDFLMFGYSPQEFLT